MEFKQYSSIYALMTDLGLSKPKAETPNLLKRYADLELTCVQRKTTLFI